MSIFGFKPVTESSALPGISNRYFGEAEECSVICTEAAIDLANIQCGLLVADVMIDSQVLHEGANGEILLEGVIKDTKDKIVEALRKFWAKLKKWFASARKMLESFFMPIVKFVKKYENELTTKDTTGFTYKGYKWDLSDYKKVESQATSTDGVVDGVKGQLLAYHSDEKARTLSSEELNKVKKNLLDSMAKHYGSCDNISEFKENMFKSLRGNEDEAEEIEKFSAISVSTMITFIKDYKKNLDALKKEEATIDKILTKSIKTIESELKALSSEDKAKYAPIYNQYADITRYQSSITMAMVETEIKACKAMNSEFSSVLRSFLRFKPTKEGYGYLADNKSNSLLEAAMNFI